MQCVFIPVVYLTECHGSWSAQIFLNKGTLVGKFLDSLRSRIFSPARENADEILCWRCARCAHTVRSQAGRGIISSSLLGVSNFAFGLPSFSEIVHFRKNLHIRNVILKR